MTREEEIESQIREIALEYGMTQDVRDMASQFCGFKEGRRQALEEVKVRWHKVHFENKEEWLKFDAWLLQKLKE